MLFYNFLFIFDRVNYYIIKAWCRLKYQLYCSTDEDSYFIYCFKLINDSTYPNDSAHWLKWQKKLPWFIKTKHATT